MANINIKYPLGELYSENRNEMTPARRKMIHKHRKEQELYGPSLPYDFGIFKKKLGNKPFDSYVECPKCGTGIPITKITHAVICRHCSEMIVVEQDNE
jgi:DNA-directed RNA polymerase subunit RPC12/RpoP